MDRRFRITGGLLGLLAFALTALMVGGEDTVMGRVLDRAFPDLFANRARVTYDRPAAIVDITRDPPEYLGMDDAGVGTATVRSLESWHTATLRVIGRPWFGEGFWFFTRRGIETELEVSADAMHSPDIAGMVFDDALRERVRAVALAGLRRDDPTHPWLKPAGLDTAPFDAHNRTDPRRTSEIFWPGYLFNGMSLVALGLMVRAFWPRSKNRSPLASLEHA
jgi:hypothetical protein